jgi:hypothetical protein
MSIEVTLRVPFADKRRERETVTHPDGRATLVDGAGRLLVLDTPDVDLTYEKNDDGKVMFGRAEMELIKHTVATYADGEWVWAVQEAKDT